MARLAYADFETGDLSQLNESNDSASVSTDSKRNGTYGMELVYEESATASIEYGTPLSEGYACMSLYIPSGFITTTENSVAVTFLASQSNQMRAIQFLNSGTSPVIRINGLAGADDSYTASNDQWYWLRWYWNQTSTGSFTCDVYEYGNSTAVANLSAAADYSGDSAIDEFGFFVSGVDSASGTLYVDDMELHDSEPSPPWASGGSANAFYYHQLQRVVTA